MIADIDPDRASAGSSPANRHLAAIAFLDVVGYSRLIGLDEEHTIRRWGDLKAQVIEPQIRQGGGRVVQRLGDGLLVEFQSAVHAVKWALAVQLTVKDVSRSAAEPFTLRIAVHVGDVVVEDTDNIMGDGVNVAARLQEHAPPGGVAISEPVHQLVGHALDYEAEDLGPLLLKNIQRPVRAFAIAAPGATVPRKPAALPSHRPSMAVLPVRTLGPEPIEQYFLEGLSHHIVWALAAFRELFVLSSNSTLHLSSETDQAISAGQKLGVRYIVTGTVTKQANRLRLAFEMTDGETNSVVWSSRDVVAADDLFAVEDIAATKIAYSLLPHLRQSELRRAMRKLPTSMDAYDLVLQAQHRLYRFEESDRAAARLLLVRAIECDPDYAMAYALLSHWHVLELGEGRSVDEPKDIDEAARYSTAALARDPLDPLALSIHGHCLSFMLGDLDGAVATLDRALAISPNSPIAWGMSSPTHAYRGDGPAAVARAEYALRLSPLDPYAHIFHGYLGLAHYVNGTHEEAVNWSRRALAVAPRFVAVHRHLIGSLVALGRIEEARTGAARLLQLCPDFRVGHFIERYPLIDEGGRANAYAEQLLAAGLPA